MLSTLAMVAKHWPFQGQAPLIHEQFSLWHGFLTHSLFPMPFRLCPRLQFCCVIDKLYETFCQTVSLENAEIFSTSLLQWFKGYCNTETFLKPLQAIGSRFFPSVCVCMYVCVCVPACSRTCASLRRLHVSVYCVLMSGLSNFFVSGALFAQSIASKVSWDEFDGLKTATQAALFPRASAPMADLPPSLPLTLSDATLACIAGELNAPPV